jgi:hypothetical protein
MCENWCKGNIGIWGASLHTLHVSFWLLLSRAFTIGLLCSVADPGCLIPDPTIFSYRIQTLFQPGSYMKSGMQTYFFAPYAFRNKVLTLIIVKKIRDPRSRLRKKFTPEPNTGVRNHRIRIPDPQQRSADEHTKLESGEEQHHSLWEPFLFSKIETIEKSHELKGQSEKSKI